MVDSPNLVKESKTLVVLGCSKIKANYETSAQYMYKGALFKLGWKYAELIGADVIIISAKYGLLAPEDIIAPYNQRMTKTRAKEIFAEKENVIRELVESDKYSRIYFICGDDYNEVFEPVWDQRFMTLSDVVGEEHVVGIGVLLKGLKELIHEQEQKRGIQSWRKNV